MQKWIIVSIVVIILILTGILIMNFNIETEYVPETEIEDKELRKTIISLYFQDKETKEVVKENRIIDSKKLLKDPYDELLNMLMIGPENANYEKCIPSNTKILGIKLEKNIVIIDFSKEFVEESTDDIQKNNSVNSILNTLSELTEVEGIKILIEGKDFDGFKEIFSKNKDLSVS